MVAGDTIAFCQGGAFADAAAPNIASPACAAGNPCLVRNYIAPWNTGGEGKPIITVTVANNKGFFFYNAGGATHDEGYRILNLDLESTVNTSTIAMVFGNDVSDVVVCNVTMNNFNAGGFVAGSSTPLTGGSTGLSARITFQGCNITNTGNIGYLGACDGCAVNYNYFNQTGQVGDTNTHDIYVDDYYATDPTMPVEATGETIIGNSMTNSESIGGFCNGIVAVVHGQHADMTISHNTMQETAANVQGGCYGIAVTSGYVTPEHFTNVEISDNTVINPGQIGIFTTLCTGCTIENNLVIEGAINTYGIAYGDPQGSVDPVGIPGNNGTVRNNTIYMANGTQGGVGVFYGTEGTGHTIANNAIYTTSTATSNAWSCFQLTLPFSAYIFDNNNLCYFPSAAGGVWEHQTGDSLSAWQVASGFDTNSLQANPMFVNAAVTAYNFQPASGSPLISAGNHANAPVLDFNGTVRSNPPDIGAFQH
jgi:hypothetical protein